MLLCATVALIALLDMLQKAGDILIYEGSKVRPWFDSSIVITFDDFNEVTRRDFLGWKHSDLIFSLR